MFDQVVAPAAAAMASEAKVTNGPVVEGR